MTLYIRICILGTGQVIQNTVPAGMNELVCRCLIGASLVFTDCTVVLWTIINVYRLYLVVNTGKKCPRSNAKYATLSTIIQQWSLPSTLLT